MYDFKKFTAVSQKNETRITVTGSNAFGFPTRFYKDNNVNDYKYVVVYYDEHERAVGFYFTNEENEPNKFTIIKSKHGYGGSIVATSFFKSNSLDAKMLKGRYKWEFQEVGEIGKLFIIKLMNKQQEGFRSEG